MIVVLQINLINNLVCHYMLSNKYIKQFEYFLKKKLKLTSFFSDWRP